MMTETWNSPFTEHPWEKKEEKKLIKLVSFFDFVDYDSDVADIQMNVLNYNGDHDDKIQYVPCKSEDEFVSNLRSGCIALVDYGAIGCSGQSGLFEHYNKWMLKVIEEHPSIQFVYILTMGKEFYNHDELFEFPNVSTIDRVYSLKEFNKMIEGNS